MLTQSQPVWIVGSTRSGKTTHLVEQFCSWVGVGRSRHQRSRAGSKRRRSTLTTGILVFAANGENGSDLASRLAAASQGQYPVQTKTPIGFFEDEVMLFWPLLIEQLNLRAQFPVRLRPETEQELATQLWSSELEQGNVYSSEEKNHSDESIYRLVRRTLDLLRLATQSGTPIEDIASILAQGVPAEEGVTGDWEAVGQLILRWRNWCLERGVLTTGIIYELYWRYLLPHPNYQNHLKQRYQAVLADDVDDYPAVTRDLFDCLLDQGAVGAFTFNPDGGVRQGLGADPHYLEGLAGRCRVETLTQPDTLGTELAWSMVELVKDPTFLSQLPRSVQLIQTTSRAALLRQTAEVIIEVVKSGQVQPEEIAVIGPGLDAIAVYSLREILTRQDIPVQTLSQRPLITYPTIRALLTLLALVYPGLGRLIDKDAIAEMLVVLSSRQGVRTNEQLDRWADEEIEDSAEFSPQSPVSQSPVPSSDIDPVRAGLLADYCYSPDPEKPQLQPVKTFPRWDRLGHQATTAYEEILQWIEVQRSQQEQRLILTPIALLDRGIQQFLLKGGNLPYADLAALRALMETAQHYWEVDARLRQSEQIDEPRSVTIAQFIQLLRRGSVSANPYPTRPLGPTARAVTLSTVFEYRTGHRFHRWHFWLDAGSPLWLTGGTATLFGAPLFLKDWSGSPWGAEDMLNAYEQRLQLILKDLLGRVQDQIYLCHSDLATSGQDQSGPLLSLVNAAVPMPHTISL